jgi:hypothetical protein
MTSLGSFGACLQYKQTLQALRLVESGGTIIAKGIYVRLEINVTLRACGFPGVHCLRQREVVMVRGKGPWQTSLN